MFHVIGGISPCCCGIMPLAHAQLPHLSRPSVSQHSFATITSPLSSCSSSLALPHAAFALLLVFFTILPLILLDSISKTSGSVVLTKLVEGSVDSASSHPQLTYLSRFTSDILCFALLLTLFCSLLL